ncbi:hypothetical protein ACHAPT_013061 [Fusarium lateritium]
MAKARSLMQGSVPESIMAAMARSAAQQIIDLFSLSLCCSREEVRDSIKMVVDGNIQHSIPVVVRYLKIDIVL